MFAQKVMEERDRLRDQVESLKAELECSQAFHNVALRERDLAITQLRHAEADAEQAVAYAEQERERAERERNVLVEMLAHEFDWKDTSYLHAMMHVKNAIRNMRANYAVIRESAAQIAARHGNLTTAESIRDMPLLGKARCACQLEAGDSPCFVHGEDDE